MFGTDIGEKEGVPVNDNDNPISWSLKRMKIVKNFTKLEGLRDLMELTYFSGPSSFHEYYKSSKRVFSNLGIPKEMFCMLNVDSIFVEQLAVLVALSTRGTDMIEKARSIVPSSTYCTYHQAALGGIESNYFPLPDVFVAPSFICEETISLYSYLGKKYNRPVFYIDCPPGSDQGAEVYLAEQLHTMTRNLADFFNIKLKKENIEKAIYYSNEARKWWLKYQDKRSSLDTDSSDITFQTIQLSTMLYSKYGLEETVSIAKKCYEEISERVEKRAGNTSERNPRILWLHLLPYHSGALLALFRNSKLNVAADEASQIPWEELDPKRPWTSLARRLLRINMIGDVSKRLTGIDYLIEKYNIDGVIEVCHPGCKAVSGQSYLVKNHLTNRRVPHLSFEADLIDPDQFSTEHIRTRIQAFEEMLTTKRGIYSANKKSIKQSTN